ncbi:MAG TPA: hypothetical protein VK466_17565 [Terriglobales bacterium]|nr:hypothetical protein [Terriglobales bacterium]
MGMSRGGHDDGHAAIQWLERQRPAVNGDGVGLLDHELSLVPIPTPAYSPQSNGLAEGFVQFKRDM